MYIRYNDGTAQITVATGKYSTNFKAEAEALKKAAIEIRNNQPRAKPNVVIFTDALSVFSKLQNPCQKDLSEVETALVDLAAQTNLILQWITANCGIQGNEQANRLATEGGQLEQEDRYTTYTDEKTIIKTLSKKKWKQQHPNYNQSDSLHKLNRTEQLFCSGWELDTTDLTATCTTNSRLASLRCAHATQTSWLQNIYCSIVHYMMLWGGTHGWNWRLWGTSSMATWRSWGGQPPSWG